MSVPRFVRKAPIVLAVFLMFAGLVACATSKSTKSAGESPTSLTVATSFAVDDLDPLENGFWGNELGYSELLMKPQTDGTVKPWLLRSLMNTSPTSWVLTLNAGITFQDGKPLDAAALVACLAYQLKENSSATAALPGATVTATGSNQVTLTTKAPVPDVPFILGDESFFIIYDQAGYLPAKGSPAKLIAAKLYTGPYVVTSLTPQIMHTVRNPHYWKGTPALTSVTVKFISDAQARILAVQHGEADLALYPPTAAAKTLTGRNDSYFVTGTPHGPTFDFFLNLHKAPFNDELVRAAVLTGIDYQQIATQVMNNLYQQATGMYSPKASYALQTQKTDVQAAGALLDQAGWRAGPAGMRSKNGVPLTITVLTYPQQPDSGTLAVAIQAQLKKIGVEVSISQVPDTEAAMKKPTGWDAGVIGDGTTSFSGDPIPPLQEYFATGGANNYGGIADPALDELIKKLAVAIDQKASEDLLHRIQQRISDHAYMGFLGMRLPAVIAGPAWKGYQVPPANLWVDATTTAAG